jgi:hypothetical protein
MVRILCNRKGMLVLILAFGTEMNSAWLFQRGGGAPSSSPELRLARATGLEIEHGLALLGRREVGSSPRGVFGGIEYRSMAHDGERLTSIFDDGTSLLQGFFGFIFCSYGGIATSSSSASCREALWRLVAVWRQ